jgi:DNA-binding transcriptional regulator YhcF (GntR family)
MQFWFARGSEVSIREQLVTQVVLGILSDDLAPGQRLPSTRDLARRFHLHPNTISAGYRQLERERWVEFRRGSGVYIRASKPEVLPTPGLALDQMIARLFRSARQLGVTLPVLRSRLRQWLELQPPDHFLLLEPDQELRRILAAEIARAVTFPVESCGPKDCPKSPEGGRGGCAAQPRGYSATGFAAKRGADYSADSFGARFAGGVFACTFGCFGGRSLSLAGILESREGCVDRRGIPSRQPRLSRRPRTSLAARPEAKRQQWSATC